MNERSWKRLRSLLLVAATTMLFATGCGPRYFVLNPAGPVGREELHLIIWSTILTAIVIVPVLIILVIIVWRYRDRPGSKAKYKPEWSESRTLEIVWWGIPIVIVGILGAYTTKVTFNLVQPPQKDVKPITIDVTSLDWKWLFEYPDQGVATVNYLKIPTGVPINFVMTSDAPMNSFWVPSLGGQEYTMPGMADRLWLEADKSGTYYGRGANFTGTGFADMQFSVIATSQSDFDNWVKQAKSTNNALTVSGYDQLKKPSTVGKITYSSFPPKLFNDTVWAEGGRYMKNAMPDMESSMASMNGSNTTNAGTSSMNNSSSNSTN